MGLGPGMLTSSDSKFGRGHAWCRGGSAEQIGHSRSIASRPKGQTGGGPPIRPSVNDGQGQGNPECQGAAKQRAGSRSVTTTSRSQPLTPRISSEPSPPALSASRGLVPGSRIAPRKQLHGPPRRGRCHAVGFAFLICLARHVHQQRLYAACGKQNRKHVVPSKNLRRLLVATNRIVAQEQDRDLPDQTAPVRMRHQSLANHAAHLGNIGRPPIQNGNLWHGALNPGTGRIQQPCSRKCCERNERGSPRRLN